MPRYADNILYIKWQLIQVIYLIIQQLYNNLIRVIIRAQNKIMQNSSTQQKCKVPSIFTQLISKLTRLRNRLISCGYSIKEVIDIIMLQFLNIPEIDWKCLHETHNFYELKNTYKVDSTSAQIILRLQKLIPNLYTQQVCQYVLTVLEINACDFGFSLGESSSDSNDSASTHKLIIRRPIRRVKRSAKKQEAAEETLKNQASLCKKQRRKQKNNKKNVEDEVDLFFRNKIFTEKLCFQQFDIEKQIKKMPESQDSEHQ